MSYGMKSNYKGFIYYWEYDNSTYNIVVYYSDINDQLMYFDKYEKFQNYIDGLLRDEKIDNLI